MRKLDENELNIVPMPSNILNRGNVQRGTPPRQIKESQINLKHIEMTRMIEDNPFEWSDREDAPTDVKP